MTNSTFFNLFRKIAGIMVMLTMSSWLATAQDMDTGITLNMENASIQQVLKKIEQQSHFLFINKGVDIQRQISVNVSNVSITDALEKIFKGSDVSYAVDGTYIILSRKSVQEKQGPATVTGTVKDSSGEPIIGAAVIIAGTSTGVMTDIDGNYSIQIPPLQMRRALNSTSSDMRPGQ